MGQTISYRCTTASPVATRNFDPLLKPARLTSRPSVQSTVRSCLQSLQPLGQRARFDGPRGNRRQVANGPGLHMCVLSHRKTRRRRRLSMSAATAGLSCVTSRELLAPLKTTRAAGGVFGLVAVSPTDREQPFIVKQRVKISCCERGGERAATRNRSPHLLTMFSCILFLPGSSFDFLPSNRAFSRPIRRALELGHDSFMTGANDVVIERGPGTNHPR